MQTTTTATRISTSNSTTTMQVRQIMLARWRDLNVVDGMSAALTALLETLFEMASCGDEYSSFASRACDWFDFETVLGWADESGFILPRDRDVWREGMVLAMTRDRYIDNGRAALRLELAEGGCPLCGHRVRFDTRKNGMDSYDVQGKCHHLQIGMAADPWSAVKAWSAWEGYRWPVYEDRVERCPFRNPDGRMLQLSKHCRQCRYADAFRLLNPKVKAVLFDALARAKQLRRETRGQVPMGELICKKCRSAVSPCDYEATQVEALSFDILNTKGEIRLDDRLFVASQSLRVEEMGNRWVEFGMQVRSGPNVAVDCDFVDRVNRQIADLGIRTVQAANAFGLS